jgi:RNA polymerase sigma-70 factor (ECF subfamily)
MKPSAVVTGVSCVFADQESYDASELRLRGMITEHLDFVLRGLRRFRVHPSNLDDAAQQVFWIVSRKLGRIQPGCERAYLFGTAARVAADIRRVQARRLQREVTLDNETEGSVRVDELLELKQARRMLDEVLSGMSGELRTVFLLAEAEGLSAPEISGQVGIPVGTVASRLRRARGVFETSVRRLRARNVRRPASGEFTAHSSI